MPSSGDLYDSSTHKHTHTHTLTHSHTHTLLFVTLRARLLQWCSTLCRPYDFIQPGLSLHGILQERLLERVTMTSSGNLYDAPTNTHTQTHTHTHTHTDTYSHTHTQTALRERACCLASVVLDSLQTLGLFPPGSSLHWILQERILEGLPCPPPGIFMTHTQTTQTHKHTHTHTHTHTLL